MAIWNRDDNWLSGIAETDHPNHSIRGNLGDLTAEMVQASFDVTYGRGRYKASDHGTVITVWFCEGFARQLRSRAAEHRANGRDERANDLEAKAAAVSEQGLAYHGD